MNKYCTTKTSYVYLYVLSLCLETEYLIDGIQGIYGHDISALEMSADVKLTIIVIRNRVYTPACSPH